MKKQITQQLERKRAARLREIRAATGLSRERFAALIGRTATTVFRWEKGTVPIDFLTMAGIEAIVGKNLESA